jgi:hypothetical protein
MQTTKHSQKLVWVLLSHTNKEEYIHNVYKLPSIEQMVRYLHAAAGHWVKVVGRGNYNSRPLIGTKTKNFRKYFLESEETQLGHTQGQRQGVPSTRPKQ